MPEPVHSGMDEQDARYFGKCRLMSALAEDTDLIGTAFKVE
jgi:hypothetical protein